MEYPYLKLMQELASRRHLSRKVKIEFREDNYRPRLFCDSPAIVARYASQLRQIVAKNYDSAGGITLVRGQPENYSGMVPALFRLHSGDAVGEVLERAEEELERRLRGRIRLGRFQREHLGALLQHYGFRTSWLDLVDNLWAAVWFAAHTIKNGIASQRESGSGWLYFLAAERESERASVVDIRTEHHGLSLRPHTQHGWSLRGGQGARKDLQSHVVGVVEFPLTEAWTLSGSLFSTTFLFPPKNLDNTLKHLCEKRVDNIAATVENDFGLAEGSLGRTQVIR